MKIFSTVFTTLFLFSLGNAAEIELPAGNEVEAKGYLKMSAAWIEDEGKSFDINLTLQNTSDTGLIVFANTTECWRNGMRGKLKYTFFNTGEKTMDFKPGEAKTNNYICKLDSKQKGEEYKIVIKNVYVNKNLDGKTVSEKPVVKELVWEQKFINGLPVAK